MSFPETTDALVDIFPGDTQRSKSHRVRHNAANEALREQRDYLQGDIEDRISALEGGGGGGGIRIVDLGVVDVTDLLAGPVTLHTPGAGELVLSGSPAGAATATDAGSIVVAAGVTGLGSVDTNGNSPAADSNWSSSPIVATLYDGNDRPITGAWATATAYGMEDAIIANGTVWSAIDAGTSGPGGGRIVTASLDDGGSGWTVGDFADVDDGAGNTTASIEVLTVTGDAIATFSVIAHGGGYATGVHPLTGGAGTGSISIDSVTAAGTPDFAAVAAETANNVSDGGVVWFDTGVAPPATGSAHFYALVATPVAP